MGFISEYIYLIGEYITGGGVVMVPLFLVSFVMWLLIFYRAWFLNQLYYRNMPRKQAGELLRRNELPAETYQGVNAVLIRQFMKKKTGDPSIDMYILDETVMAFNASLDKYQAIINVLAGISPLLGLLGTVTGMISTFDVITQYGTGNVKALSGGISEALITTQTGLLISIPGLYMSGFLTKRTHNIKHRIASVGIYLKRFL